VERHFDAGGPCRYSEGGGNRVMAVPPLLFASALPAAVLGRVRPVGVALLAGPTLATPPVSLFKRFGLALSASLPAFVSASRILSLIGRYSRHRGAPGESGYHDRSSK
jgi:hypothetical protein